MNILNRNLAVGFADKRQLRRFRILDSFGIEVALGEPNPRRVVMMIFLGIGAEDVAEVPLISIRIQVMTINKILDAVCPHVVVRIVEIDRLNGNLISRNRITIVRDADGDPLMAGHDFHVPDFVLIVKLHAVAFSRSILFHEITEIPDAFARTVDKRQD